MIIWSLILQYTKQNKNNNKRHIGIRRVLKADRTTTINKKKCEEEEAIFVNGSLWPAYRFIILSYEIDPKTFGYETIQKYSNKN